MKRNRWQVTLAILLAAIMLLAMVPANVAAMSTAQQGTDDQLESSGLLNPVDDNHRARSSDEETIWAFLYGKIGNAYGTAGLMGNLYAESSLKANNLQNSYEGSLGYTDETYTAAVDNGSYTSFVNDAAGYGLAQWTYYSRKQNLLNYAHSSGTSIGNLNMQLSFLWSELTSGYSSLVSTLMSASSVEEASTAVLTQFERPANMGSSIQSIRAGYGQTYYDHYAPVTFITPSYTPSSYYQASKYYTQLCNVSLTGAQRTDILNVALSQVGYHEGNDNAGMSGLTNGDCNYTEYNYWYYGGSHNGGDPYAWCAVFVSWCARQAQIPTSILKNSNAAGCSSSYFNLTYYSGNNYTPQPGDLFFTSGWTHVGLVYYVDGNGFYTVEGNYDNKVLVQRRSGLSNYWFGVPNYTGGTQTPSPDPTLTSDSKYSSFRGFKGYLCTSDHVVCYNRDLTTSPGRIYTSDYCTINDVYTNGWCQVSCPWNDGTTKIVYTQISNFIKTPSTAIGSFTATAYMNLYSTASMSSQIFRVYPGDVCYTIGTSGSATQIFMPHNSGYYVLGWVATSGIPSSSSPSDYTIDYTFPTPFTCRFVGTDNEPCYASPGGSQSGYLDYNDDCIIQEVYCGPSGYEGWCKVTYPVGNGTATRYIGIEQFIHYPRVAIYQMSAPKYATTYLNYDAANSIGWIDPGDTIYVMSVCGSMTQIVYPATTSTGNRCGWVYTSELQESYTVSYNANGGAGAPASQTKLNTADLVLSSTVPVKAGYMFMGWSTSASATTPQYYPGSTYSTNASVTLYAVWSQSTYTVSYSDSSSSTAQYHYGNNVVFASTAGTQDGYTFVGWYLHRDTDGKWYCANNAGWKTDAEIESGSYTINQYSPGITMNIDSSWISGLTGDISFTLYPVLILNTYTVTFKDWDGTVLKTQTVNYGAAASAPADPTRVGYTFTGWDREFNSITENTVVTAQYAINSYTVTYYIDGEQYGTQTVEYGAQIEPPQVDVEGYTFSGWMLADGSDVPEEMPAHDLDVFGMLARNYVTVTYTGAYIGTAQVPFGGNAVLPVLDAVGVHYTFTVNGEPWDGVALTGDVTVEVGMDINVYTVAFVDPVDGQTLSVQSVTHGQNASAPAAPQHYGYTFGGWDTEFTNVQSDLTVMAIYDPIEYTVVFMDGCDNVIETQSVPYLSAATAPADPVREGWTFTGWDVDFSCVEHALIINATWSRNYYTVTFVGVYSGTVTVEHGADCELPVYNSSSVHYTFSVNGEPWDGKCIVGDVTVTVGVAVNGTYTVTFLDWDGSVIDTQQVAYGGAAAAPADPSREGYTFIGWDGDFSCVTADVAVTALYEENSAPTVVTGDVNGDGMVTATDISVLFAYVMNAGSLSADAMLAADVNGDGAVNATDASLLAQMVFGA